MMNVYQFIKELVKVVIFNAKGKYGYRWRYNYWKKRLNHLGENVLIETNVTFENPSFISIGDNVWINKNAVLTAGAKEEKKRKFYKKVNKEENSVQEGYIYIKERTHIGINCVIIGHGGVSIGRNCSIAACSCVYSVSHHYRNLTDKKDFKQYSFSSMAKMEDQFVIYGNVKIEDYCSIGLNSVVLPGSIIMKGSCVEASSLVNKKIESQKVFKNNGNEIKNISKYHLP